MPPIFKTRKRSFFISALDKKAFTLNMDFRFDVKVKFHNQ